MGKKERKIIDNVLLEGSKHGRMFRVNCGMGWVGKLEKKNKGKVLLSNAYPFHGMPEGTPDVIGWESIEICEYLAANMQKHPCLNYELKKNDKTPCVTCPFHKKLAIFKAVEIKTGKLKLSPGQKNWKNILLEHGGIYEEKRE